MNAIQPTLVQRAMQPPVPSDKLKNYLTAMKAHDLSKLLENKNPFAQEIQSIQQLETLLTDVQQPQILAMAQTALLVTILAGTALGCVLTPTFLLPAVLFTGLTPYSVFSILFALHAREKLKDPTSQKYFYEFSSLCEQRIAKLRAILGEGISLPIHEAGQRKEKLQGALIKQYQALQSKFNAYNETIQPVLACLKKLAIEHPRAPRIQTLYEVIFELENMAEHYHPSPKQSQTPRGDSTPDRRRKEVTQAYYTLLNAHRQPGVQRQLFPS